MVLVLAGVRCALVNDRRRGGRSILNATAPRNGLSARNAH
jgi:hypothetical protein